MSKKIFTILISLCMVFTMMPAMTGAAFAGSGPTFDDRFGGEVTSGNYTSYVSGSNYNVHDDVSYTFAGWYTGIDGTGEVLSGELDDITYHAKWTKDGNTVITQTLHFDGISADKSGDGYLWNNSEKRLTLSGLTVDIICNGTSVPGIVLPDDTTVELENNSSNYVTVMNTGETAYGVHSLGVLNVTGTGSLKIESEASGTSYGLSTNNAKLDIQQANIEVSAGNYSIFSSNSVTSNDAISISNAAKVITTATKGYALGAYSGRLTIAGDNTKVIAKGGSMSISAGTASQEGTLVIKDKANVEVENDVDNATAVFANKGISLASESSLTVTMKQETSKNAQAVYAKTDKIVIDNSKVNVKFENGHAYEEIQFGIFADAGNIEINGDKSNVTVTGGSNGIEAGQYNVDGTSEMIIGGGEVTADTGVTALWAKKAMKITGGTVKATSHGYLNNKAKAVYSTGTINISGKANVTATCVKDTTPLESTTTKYYAIRSKGDVTIKGEDAVVIAIGSDAAFNFDDGITFTANKAVVKAGIDEMNAAVPTEDIREAITSAKYVSINVPVCKIGDKEYKTISKAIKAAGSTPSNIILNYDVTEDITIKSTQDITLDLNGHVLKGSGTGSVITNKGKLTILDSDLSTAHYFKVAGSGQWELRENYAGNADYTFDSVNGLKKNGATTDEIPAENSYIKVYGGCITGGIGTSSSNIRIGGGIYSKSAVSLNIAGGNIVGNTASDGGGIYSKYSSDTNPSEFTMTGGAVIGNLANKSSGYASGGGMYLNCDSDITRGVVSYNCLYSEGGSGAYGGGIYCSREMTVSDSNIFGNRVSGYGTCRGGGIYSKCKVNINKSEISHNKIETDDGVSAFGGGLFITSSTQSDINIINDSNITGNIVKVTTNSDYITKASGGGAAVQTATLLMAGNTNVNNNTAINESDINGEYERHAFGGGIYGGGNASIYIQSDEVIISGNVADASKYNNEECKIQGGGVYTGSTATFIMTAGTISGNIVKGNSGTGEDHRKGGGVCVTYDTTPFTVGGTAKIYENYAKNENSNKAVANNVFLRYDDERGTNAIITVGEENNALTNGANICVSRESGAGFITTNGDSNDIHYFHSDNDKYIIRYTDNKIELDYLDVAFDSNGGSAVAAKKAAKYECVEKPENPIYAGYTFGGWYTDQACTNAWNFANDIVTNDMTLYARWIKNSEKKAVITGTVTDDASPSNIIQGAAVELWLGTEKVAAANTDAQGEYTFDNVENGIYNIVVIKDEKTKTTVVNVNSATSFTADPVVLPTKDVNSKVELKNTAVVETAKTDASSIVVGGVDTVAEAEEASAGNIITIVLTVEPKEEDNSNDQQNAIKNEAGNKTVEFIDFTLTKQVNNGDKENIGSSNSKLLTIMLPFDTTGVEISSIAVYRYHDSNAAVLTRIYNEANKADGTFMVGDGYITIYAEKFSTYAIGYTEKTETKSASYFGGGGVISQKPYISVNGNVNYTLSSDGSKLKISVPEGQKLTDVKVNGVSKGAVTELTGLKTGDEVEIITEAASTQEESIAEAKGDLSTAIALNKFIAKSKKVTKKGKSAIKVTWNSVDGADGYAVYRATSKNGKYTKMYETTKLSYTNTKSLKKGKTYYYKVKAYKLVNGEKAFSQWSTKAYRTIK